MVRPSIFLVAASAFPSVAADTLRAGQGPLQATATIDLAVRIPDEMRVALLDHPAVLHITAAESKIGEVEVSGARILLVANRRCGFTLNAALAGGFSEASIDGLGIPVRVAAGAGATSFPSMIGQRRPSAQPVRYRFRFKPGLPPGDHPWPLALSVARL